MGESLERLLEKEGETSRVPTPGWGMPTNTVVCVRQITTSDLGEAIAVWGSLKTSQTELPSPTTVKCGMKSLFSKDQVLLGIFSKHSIF